MRDWLLDLFARLLDAPLVVGVAVIVGGRWL